jgi:antitoxin component of MazEF toxin-antitoxin module
MSKLIGKAIRRIIRVGDSYGITLPREYVEAHGLRIGDLVEISYNESVRVKPIKLEQQPTEEIEHE